MTEISEDWRFDFFGNAVDPWLLEVVGESNSCQGCSQDTGKIGTGLTAAEVGSPFKFEH